jgi:type II secretory pathway pseudopilin PulG
MRGMLRRVREAQQRDAGITTVELIVAMGIFVTVIAIFMGGVVVMTKNAVRSTVTANAGDSARLVLQRFDKQVRYADAINLPGPGTGGRQYIEFRTPATVAASGVTTCTQWRWDPTTTVMEMRSWADGATSLPAFVSVAKGIVADPSVPKYPFALDLASPVHPRQEVTVSLLLSGAQGARVSTASSYVARNSSVESPSNVDNPADGVSDTPVCWKTGVRP